MENIQWERVDAWFIGVCQRKTNIYITLESKCFQFQLHCALGYTKETHCTLQLMGTFGLKINDKTQSLTLGEKTAP